MKNNIQLPQFFSAPSCTLCDLHQGAKNPGVPTRFFEQSEPSSHLPPLIVVGMNPGVREDNTGISFLSPSGSLLTSVYLKHDEILRASVYLTNAARCRTQGNGESPKNKHYKACFPYLLEDIEKIIEHHSAKKSILLCLGSHAYGVVSQHFIGKRHSLRHGFNNQGQPSALLLPNELNIYATFHPSAVLREKKYLYPVSDHMELVARAINGTLPTPSLPDIEEPRWPTN